MNLSRFVRPQFALLVFSIFCSLAHCAERPNILLLLSDDHSYPYVSCYGSSNVRTPTLDQLASDGIKFHRYLRRLLNVFLPERP